MSFGGFQPQAQVRPTDQIEVLEAIVAKLRASIPAFSEESTCFISESPDPSIEIQSNLFAMVSPSNGTFDQSMVDGSGNLGLSETFGVVVSVFSRLERDELERYLIGLTDPTNGLLSLKKQVLKAIGGKNLDGGLFNGFDSLLLLEALTPSRSTHPNSKQYDELATFSLTFDCRFWWDMQSPSSVV